ncbi:hypothetical protein J5Y09_20660 [Roseomonas sp. PWR1]|uniref:DUF2339 domain-containing protein n=1 Tax=Roseomonas nitratireducens TaxID=2820810 RepID=A0ABS4AYA5_9PROT|nr:hypothetical protein [Neoroseomonas nitratireducens]MBP0466352.1 hypothetical protein [Neoroseomonas nitratireducens]
MADTLQALTARLTIPGLPEWVGLVLLVALGVSLLAFLAMPYAVFGVKSRLEAVEAELADLRTEIRALVRQPPPARPLVEEDWVAPPTRTPGRAGPAEPRLGVPVPPPAARAEGGGARRAEPRLDWPQTKG